MIDLKEFSDLIYDKLSALNIETVLEEPQVDSVFPCFVIRTPLESVRESMNAQPLMKQYQVTVEYWDNSKRKCMEISSLMDSVLSTLNMIRTNTSNIDFDSITRKNRIICTYEVRYDCIHNSFVFIR